jgi:signal transduction histidine kinase
LQASLDKLAETQMQLVQQEKMASIGTLTAGIAHEINNPAHFAHLGVFNLRNKVARFQEFLLGLAGPDAPGQLVERIKQHVLELNQDLDVVSEGTIRIRDLVRDLRTFSRLDEADWKSVHIADSLIATVNLVRTQYVETAQIQLDLQANPLLECWPAQLNQVFMNLIINACQAIQARQLETGSSAPGLLSIRSHLQDQWLVIEFEDNGCGMSQQTIDQIYDPFFTTKTVGEGMGMGLSISFGIIKKHHGTILVTSVLGQGTCFTLHLPLLPSQHGIV